MSTQTELLKQGVLRMKRPEWVGDAHIEYKRVGADGIGPWVTVWSPAMRSVMPELYEMSVLITVAFDGDNDWTAYEGPRCEPLGGAR